LEPRYSEFLVFEGISVDEQVRATLPFSLASQRFLSKIFLLSLWLSNSS
jgi:hypothetical protein